MSNTRFSRRSFLKYAGSGALMLGAGGLLQACQTPGPTPTSPTTMAPATPTTTAATASSAKTGKTLKMWWWGEQEAPGLEGWLNESILLFQEQTGHSIEQTLQDTNSVISEFQTASAANSAPDIQFLWNGAYHMESVWLNYVEPLDGLVPDDLLNQSNATVLSVYKGKQYRLGWYAEGPLWLYSKEMFDKAGLDTESPPDTFEALMAACDKLKTAGFTPITAGLKDGQWGDWYLTQALVGNLDTAADVVQLFIGGLDWRDPRYYEPWSRLEELWKAGFLNNDMNSIDLYPGIELFGDGKGAMTSLVVPLVADQISRRGTENLGPMVLRVCDQGTLKGSPIVDSSGLGISSLSSEKEVAAEFLEFLHTGDRLAALWAQVKAMPTDTTFEGKLIEDSLLNKIWSEWVNNPKAVPYLGGLMPGVFWTDGMFVNSQKIISGEFTGEQAGENASRVAEKWREQNPDIVENYEAWAEDLGSV